MVQKVLLTEANGHREFLQQKQAQYEEFKTPLLLVIQQPVTPPVLSEISEYYRQLNDNSVFKRIQLKLTPEIVKTQEFAAFIKQLNQAKMIAVDLIFDQKDFENNDFLTLADQSIADAALFPITLNYLDPNGKLKRDENEKLHLFAEKMMKKLLEASNSIASVDSEPHPEMQLVSPDDDYASAPIKLKELISRSPNSTINYHDHLKLEVQYTENEDVEEAVNEEVDETTDVQIEAHIDSNVQDITVYQGELVDYDKFAQLAANKPQKLLTLLQTECFANLPNAIKFMTPDAANMVKEHLEALVTLNIKSLPQGFTLRKTVNGELILDYDEFADLTPFNPFTPTLAVTNFNNDEPPLYFPGSLIHADVNSRNINLGIRHGESKTVTFHQQIEQLNQKNPILGVIVTDYLDNFSHLDHLADNTLFADTLNKLKDYNQDKSKCLSKFLENTGSSLYDLPATIVAFEAFWFELSVLCDKNRVDIAKINSDWTTPEGGHPAVYMERLLTILKNARNLDEQLVCLKGLKLSNYGAYYASEFGHYKTVSKTMRHGYNPAHSNAREFDINQKYHHVSLEQLSEYSKTSHYSEYFIKNCLFIETDKIKLTLEEFQQLSEQGKVHPYSKKRYEEFKENKSKYLPFYRHDGKNAAVRTFEPLGHRFDENSYTRFMPGQQISRADLLAIAYRFLGLQQSSIRVDAFEKLLEKLNDEYQFYNGIIYPEKLFALLFAVCHENYDPKADLLELFSQIMSMQQDDLAYLNTTLVKLYSRDIKFKTDDLYTLVRMIGGMNSAEYEGFEGRHNKSDFTAKHIIDRVAQATLKNKYAVFRTLEWRRKYGSLKWPLNFAMDSADSLVQNPVIAANYRDDLLLFCTLINGNNGVYYQGDRRGFDFIPLEKTEGYLKKISDFLCSAAQQNKPNNFDYCFRLLLQSNDFIRIDSLTEVIDEVSQLTEFSTQKVEAILRKHHIDYNAAVMDFVCYDNYQVKAELINLLLALDVYQQQGAAAFLQFVMTDSEGNPDANRLHQLSIAELQTQLNTKWQESGALIVALGSTFVKDTINRLKDYHIQSTFSGDNPVIEVIGKNIRKLPDFADIDDFAKLNHIMAEVEQLANMLREIVDHSHVTANIQEYAKAFARLNFADLTYETTAPLFQLLLQMPQRNALGIINGLIDSHIIGDKERWLSAIGHISRLNSHNLPTAMIEQCVKIINKGSADEYALFITNVIDMYLQDSKNPALTFILSCTNLPLATSVQLMQHIKLAGTHYQSLAQILDRLSSEQKLTPFADKLGRHQEKSTLILHILSRANANNTSTADDYLALTDALLTMPLAQLEQLNQFYDSSIINAPILLNALKYRPANATFEQFLTDLEKQPFGKRNISEQFDTSQLKRVVNNLRDLSNGSTYTFEYRQQLMEAFQFINEAGQKLAVYQGKPACGLTNQTIREEFKAIKDGKYNHLNQFQRQLYTLGLVREAMFRATGQFPTSTQMIAVIDSMMHQGDVISNIATGQGKSLIDMMKAIVLWIDSDRVDVITSSQADSNRDIEKYGPLLKFLEIPHSEQAITSQSPFDRFKATGINFSTPQLALFFARAEAQGIELENGHQKISAVLNESDHIILDDKTVYRSARTSNLGISPEKEWIYDAINQFVTSSDFVNSANGQKTSQKEDIEKLRNYLIEKAKIHKVSPRFIARFDNQQLLTWIQSAILVNYKLKEKIDYVVSPETEMVRVNNIAHQSHLIKILMKDGKVSEDSEYGDGAHQLLCAKLNAESNGKRFVIKPETKTITSSINLNFINYYRSKDGIIWGSTGTPGSENELKTQFAIYGIEFSEIPTHQERKAVEHQAVAYFDRNQQQANILDLLQKKAAANSQRPIVIFCKDIPDAENLFRELSAKGVAHIQLYTGVGDEKEVVAKAAAPGCVTITTPALGRNTDITYDRAIGMDIVHTTVDSVRKQQQKSGRTGRQGSPGDIYYFLNAQELGGKEIKDVVLEIETASNKERAYNEELFAFLGYCYNQIRQTPTCRFTIDKAAFIKNHWSDLSRNIENLYRQQRSNNDYNQARFADMITAQFNRVMTAYVNGWQSLNAQTMLNTITGRHQQPETYSPYSAEVTTADCIPPGVIAYHFTGTAQAPVDAQSVKQAVKAQLTSLFAKTDTKKVGENTLTYVNYLLQNPQQQQLIREAHQEFISEKLKTAEKARGFFDRRSQLGQIAQDSNYLLLFKAMHDASGNESMVDAAQLKTAVTKLLEDYLRHSWFISGRRRKEAVCLQRQLQRTETIGEMINLLSKAQTTIAAKDINQTKESFLNWPALNARGSRLQKTLSAALNLTGSLTTVDNQKLVESLLTVLPDTLKNKIDLKKEKVTPDVVNKILKEAQVKDKNNFQVLKNSLESLLGIRTTKPASVMIGRHNLFKKEESRPDETRSHNNQPGQP
ncbi:hypothetical protein ACFORL_01635 [Legionella dresdenensis]|uniref:Protein translocase subunit SecA n=1 Tax=Legionella dresdenensis TaxID=450200 RepID=A0ABV8CCG1_9GAMM